MARTTCVLGKRTRRALYAAQTGEFGGSRENSVDFLLRVMRDSKKADRFRIEAATAVASYLAPQLTVMKSQPITLIPPPFASQAT